MLNYVYKVYKCPVCDRESRRHSTCIRSLLTLGGRQKIKVSKHYCAHCRKHFQAPIPLVSKKRRYSDAVVNEALKREGTLQQVEIYMHQQYGIRIPQTTLHDWARAAQAVEEAQPCAGNLAPEEKGKV